MWHLRRLRLHTRVSERFPGPPKSGVVASVALGVQMHFNGLLCFWLVPWGFYTLRNTTDGEVPKSSLEARLSIQNARTASHANVYKGPEL